MHLGVYHEDISVRREDIISSLGMFYNNSDIPPCTAHLSFRVKIVTQFKNNLFLVIFLRNSLAHVGEKVMSQKFNLYFSHQELTVQTKPVKWPCNFPMSLSGTWYELTVSSIEWIPIFSQNSI